MLFYDVYENVKKISLPGGSKRGHELKVTNNTKTTAVFFPRGSKKRKSINDDQHGHGQEKRRPSIMLRGRHDTA